MKKLFFAASAAGLALISAASAETCALDDADFTPAANDESAPAADIVLMSVGLGADGAFSVSSAKRASAGADYAWQARNMVGDLASHAAPAGADTPFDLELSADTVIVFRLEPKAWKWDRGNSLFLKRGQRHNPFTAVDTPGPRMAAVRFHAPAELRGCSYEYNLGVVVNQGGRKTPLVLDPEIKNGGKGN